MNRILSYFPSCPGGREQCEVQLRLRDLLGRYANWSRSRLSGMMALMTVMTRLSKHFINTDVSGRGI